MGKKDGNTDQSNTVFAWKEVIDRVANHFRMSWQDVTQMNIYTFNDRCKFIEMKDKKELINSKRYANKSARSRRTK